MKTIYNRCRSFKPQPHICAVRVTVLIKSVLSTTGKFPTLIHFVIHADVRQPTVLFVILLKAVAQSPEQAPFTSEFVGSILATDSCEKS
jgi:hypothetical protein